MKSIYCIGAMAIAMTMTSCATTSLPKEKPKNPLPKGNITINVTEADGRFSSIKCMLRGGKVFTIDGVKYCIKKVK